MPACTHPKFLVASRNRFARFEGYDGSVHDWQLPVCTISPNAGDQSPSQRIFPFPQYSSILQAAFVRNSNLNATLARLPLAAVVGRVGIGCLRHTSAVPGDILQLIAETSF